MYLMNLVIFHLLKEKGGSVTSVVLRPPSCDPGGDVIAASHSGDCPPASSRFRPPASESASQRPDSETESCTNHCRLCWACCASQTAHIISSAAAGPRCLQPCRSLDRQTAENGFNRVRTKTTLFLSPAGLHHPHTLRQGGRKTGGCKASIVGSQSVGQD